MNRITDMCKNNTLPQTSLVGGNKLKIHVDRKLKYLLTAYEKLDIVYRLCILKLIQDF